VLIRQKESNLLTKLANMLRAEERRPERERDHELIAIFNRTIEDLKRQREREDKEAAIRPLKFARQSAPTRRVSERRAGACHDATGVARHDQLTNAALAAAVRCITAPTEHHLSAEALGLEGV
jgi:hypothetical protein